MKKSAVNREVGRDGVSATQIGDGDTPSLPNQTKIVCSRAGPTEAIASFAPVNSAMAFR